MSGGISFTESRFRLLEAVAEGEVVAAPARRSLVLLFEAHGLVTWARGGAFELTPEGRFVLEQFRAKHRHAAEMASLAERNARASEAPR
jgi:hypothetical protein